MSCSDMGSGHSMRYYVVGAFGRAICMALLALVLFLGANWPSLYLSIAVMTLWTAYAFVSGIVAVPYNHIVARSVPSECRSRLLATRFFGGGVLALGVVAIADRLVGNLAFPLFYAGIITMASVLMFASSVVFTAMGEPEAKPSQVGTPGLFQYLRDGIEVFNADHRFRMFVYSQWCGGAVLMAMPFYVVQANVSGFELERVALLLGAQTVGALASNALWGWWGDKLGKLSLLRIIAAGRIFPPMAVLILGFSNILDGGHLLVFYIAIFFGTGALANGLTIAVIGFLMEISPDDRRPAYSGYFNAMTASAFLLPLLAGIIATFFGLLVVFGLSMIAAALQIAFLTRVSAPSRS